MRWLARREHSTDELTRKLRRRGVRDAAIVDVIATLRAENALSDARFAESFVRVRVERGQGPLRIRAELRERGLSDDAVGDVLTATSEEWLEHARRVRTKRFGAAAPDSRRVWNQQARFLAQRGYPADVIYRLLGRLPG